MVCSWSDRCGFEILQGTISGSPAKKEANMASPTCSFCGQRKLMMWFCRQCRLHFCADCAGGGFISFKCPRGHQDVTKVAG